MLEIHKYIPNENWFVGLLFDEGYWFVQLLRKQQLTRYMPYWFNDGDVIAYDGTSGWTAPSDSSGRRYLEPQEEETLYQIFTGITPTNAQLYLQYTQRVDRMNLITPRTVPGDIGFWDGEISRYRDPSPETELWTVHNLYPHMNVYNPADTNMTNESHVIGASFYITPYTYAVVKDRNKIMQFLRKDKPATIRTMGDGDRPIKAPSWLLNDYSQYMLCPEDITTEL